MSSSLSRRRFLSTSLGALAGSAVMPRGALADSLLPLASGAEQSNVSRVTLQATRRTLEVNGKAATVLGLLQPNGTQGLTTMVNDPFRVVLENKLTAPTAIHWHGLHPPNNDDGVPGVTMPVVRRDEASYFDFRVHPAGTHWMHSHEGFQEASLLAAPLIVRDPADQARDEQEIVLMFSDFSFTPPQEIYARLRASGKASPSTLGEGQPMNMGGAKTAQSIPAIQTGKPDANDVNYDAYLANDRDLNDPDVVKVEKNGRLRLRIINGSSGTNYFIDLGALTGEAIAVDGMPIKPVQGSRFPLAIAQRIDIRVRVPRDGGAFPILALREASAQQTGVFLATPGATIPRLAVKANEATGLLTLNLESRLTALKPLTPKSPDQVSILKLQGNMVGYQWFMNGIAFDVAHPGTEKAQVKVKMGQRVALKFVNETPMSHPMHLHGHSFQVVAINDRPLNGALRDTVLVPGNNSVTVVFDADNPGLWFLHCHILWHLAAGMAVLVKYDA